MHFLLGIETDRYHRRGFPRIKQRTSTCIKGTGTVENPFPAGTSLKPKFCEQQGPYILLRTLVSKFCSRSVLHPTMVINGNIRAYPHYPLHPINSWTNQWSAKSRSGLPLLAESHPIVVYQCTTILET